MKLRPYQDECIDAAARMIASGKRRVALVAPTGCHAKGAAIMMHDGSVTAVEDIVVGDLVMGHDGRHREVLRLHRGVDEMFRIHPIKGEPFEVNAGHILSLMNTSTREIENISVTEYLAKSKTYKHLMKLYRAGVDFPTISGPAPVEPYFLGLLLGDGGLGYGVSICNNDDEIAQQVRRQASIWGVRIRIDGSGTSQTKHLVARDRGGRNPLLVAMRTLGLIGHGAGGKFIPGRYRLGSHQERLEILAGLIDTDGHLSNGGYDYISKSEALARGVAFIARSLGLAAYVKGCTKSCQNDFSAQYFRVSISGDCDMIPCRVARKQCGPRRQTKSALVTGFSAKAIGSGEFFGFECSGDHLYLMGDFTVTHNSGKTVVAAQIAKRAVAKGKHVLFLAHRRELIKQAEEKLITFGVDPGVIMAGEDIQLDYEVQVASIDTLRARALKTDRMQLPHADLLVIDEMHRSLAPTYVRLINEYSNAVVIGLTATPVRGDGKGLGHIYDCMVELPSVSKLTEQGFLVPARYFAPTIPDLTGIKVVRGDYDQRQLSEAMDKRRPVGDVIENWGRICPDRKTIVFASGVKHSIHLRDEFVRAGISAVHIDGEMQRHDRDDAIDGLRSGKYQVVTNFGVLTEGFDMPELSCCVLVRPTKNPGLYLQMAGRVLRPFEGKDDTIIIDHSGNVYAHGHVADEREWSLDIDEPYIHDKKKAEIKAAKQITCVQCAHIYSGQRQCPHCGHIPQMKGQALETRHAVLTEVKDGPAQKKQYTMFEKQEWYSMLRGYAVGHGKSDGWVAHTYKSKFGVWPRGMSDDGVNPSLEVLGFIRHRNIAYAKRKQKEQAAQAIGGTDDRRGDARKAHRSMEVRS